mmetsp:Transcript_6762/g.22258  ORF Transcript_6762/g.22258 Transcript_6762/m.22258 type:complete len:207 (-) Transcript_6762:158-778(-)
MPWTSRPMSRSTCINMVSDWRFRLRRTPRASRPWALRSRRSCSAASTASESAWRSTFMGTVTWPRKSSWLSPWSTSTTVKASKLSGSTPATKQASFQQGWSVFSIARVLCEKHWNFGGYATNLSKSRLRTMGGIQKGWFSSIILNFNARSRCALKSVCLRTSSRRRSISSLRSPSSCFLPRICSRYAWVCSLCLCCELTLRCSTSL